jgi:uncharacterized circularly permuted ATP-grasp superfamily protein/uncharacterized alpha-E superfamily protein
MNEHSSQAMDQAPRALRQYRAFANAYDELVGENGFRPHWAPLVDYLRTDAGVPLQPPTSEGTRPWELDTLPLLLDPGEWQVLERGLLQRAELLNTIVRDIYGPQKVLRNFGLPPALIFANPEYLVPCKGYGAPDGTYLHLLAFDLGRSPDGQWRVLSHRTEAPIGLGFALENRINTARLFPDLLDEARIVRLAGFYRQLADKFSDQGARAGGDGLVVILSGGSAQPSYAEHTYLGQYLGFPVVEGADLTVRDGRVFLKTLNGLKPVATIVRQIESSACDPLQLLHSSMTGTAGLLHAAATGRVAVANAIGSGVAENEALMSFLPGLCQSLLGEELVLPNVATWWCGQPREARYVMDNLEHIVLRDAFQRKPLVSSSVAAYMSPVLPTANIDELQKAIAEQPYNFVGKEIIRLSTAPYWSNKDTLQAAPVTLRLFVGATPDGYQLMQGGLARIATDRGDLSKDVWVSGASTQPGSPRRTVNVVSRASDQDLPSRTGDDLFWLGRYLERTEGAVRTYRSLLRYVAEGGDAHALESEILTGVLVTLGHLSARRAQRAMQEGRNAVEQELWHILFDPESVDGLAKLLGNVHRTAEQVRERLSRDAWALFQRLDQTQHLRWRVHTINDAMQLLNDLVMRLSAVSGQVADNMTRSYGWRLLDLGRRIERIRHSVKVIRELCAAEHPGPTTSRLDLLLDIQDSVLTYRTRYQNAPHLIGVLDLLLLDGANPRSVAYQVERITRHVQQMPLEDTSTGLSESQRTIYAIHNDLALADVNRLSNVVSKKGMRTHLQRLLKRTETGTDHLSDLINKTYFEHTVRTDR